VRKRCNRALRDEEAESASQRSLTYRAAYEPAHDAQYVPEVEGGRRSEVSLQYHFLMRHRCMVYFLYEQ
jgi:hypothetical protein